MPTPLPVHVVGRVAGALALLAVAAFVAILVLLAVAGAGSGRDVSGTPAGSAVLDIALPIMAGAAIVSTLLALLNQIGIRPWFDEKTGRRISPLTARERAGKSGGLLAALLLIGTLVSLGMAVLVIVNGGVSDADAATVLVRVLVIGIGATIAAAGIAGGIAIMGWFGIVPGLALGVGMVGVVDGPVEHAPAATVLGVISIGVSVAAFYGGARYEGTIPDSIASRTADRGPRGAGSCCSPLASWCWRGSTTRSRCWSGESRRWAPRRAMRSGCCSRGAVDVPRHPDPRG